MLMPNAKHGRRTHGSHDRRLPLWEMTARGRLVSRCGNEEDAEAALAHLEHVVARGASAARRRGVTSQVGELLRDGCDCKAEVVVVRHAVDGGR